MKKQKGTNGHIKYTFQNGILRIRDKRCKEAGKIVKITKLDLESTHVSFQDLIKIKAKILAEEKMKDLYGINESFNINKKDILKTIEDIILQVLNY